MSVRPHLVTSQAAPSTCSRRGEGPIGLQLPVHVPASHPAPSRAFSHRAPCGGALSSRRGAGPFPQRASALRALAAWRLSTWVWGTLETSRKSPLGSRRSHLFSPHPAPFPAPDLPATAQTRENAVGLDCISN